MLHLDIVSCAGLRHILSGFTLEPQAIPLYISLEDHTVLSDCEQTGQGVLEIWAESRMKSSPI